MIKKYSLTWLNWTLEIQNVLLNLRIWWWALNLQKLFSILLEWASLWWMVYGAQTKTSCSEKGKVQPPPPEEGGKKPQYKTKQNKKKPYLVELVLVLLLEIGSNWLVQIFALCPSRNNVGVIFLFFEKTLSLYADCVQMYLFWFSTLSWKFPEAGNVIRATSVLQIWDVNDFYISLAKAPDTWNILTVSWRTAAVLHCISLLW